MVKSCLVKICYIILYFDRLNDIPLQKKKRNLFNKSVHAPFLLYVNFVKFVKTSDNNQRRGENFFEYFFLSSNARSRNANSDEASIVSPCFVAPGNKIVGIISGKSAKRICRWKESVTRDRHAGN